MDAWGLELTEAVDRKRSLVRDDTPAFRPEGSGWNCSRAVRSSGDPTARPWRMRSAMRGAGADRHHESARQPGCAHIGLPETEPCPTP